jgi:hypothetical protein
LFFLTQRLRKDAKAQRNPIFLNCFSSPQVLLNADWGFFAPLHLCVIFALKKISLAEVLGYTPVIDIFIEPFSPFFTAL